MSTVSGVFPNAITPTFAPSTDPAEQARLRRQNEATAFAPVEEVAQAESSRRAGIAQPGRLEAELATTAAAQNRSTNQEQTTEQDSATDDIVSAISADDAEESRQQQLERQQASDERLEQEQLDQDLALIRELAARDREVRAHEQAHNSVGGEYAGAAEYTYEVGPDGKRYAVGGEVSIDVSKVPGDPEATIEKADQVRRAALAPAEPSAQDLRVAALASQIELEAQSELRAQQRAEVAEAAEERSEQQEIRANDSRQTEQAEAASADNSKDEEATAAEAERLDEILRRTSETVSAALEAAYQTQTAQDVGFNLDTLV